MIKVGRRVWVGEQEGCRETGVTVLVEEHTHCLRVKMAHCLVVVSQVKEQPGVPVGVPTSVSTNNTYHITDVYSLVCLFSVLYIQSSYIFIIR